MEKYTLNYRTSKGAERKLTKEELSDFNQQLHSKAVEDMNSLSIDTGKTLCTVDLTNGEFSITVEGHTDTLDKKILELDFNPKDYVLQWISFKKHVISYKMGASQQADHIFNVIGWQTNVNGKNIQRLVAVDNETGRWGLWLDYVKGVPTRKLLSLSHQLKLQDPY